jgi:hypothetical protein
MKLQTGTILEKTKFRAGWICPLLTAGCLLLVLVWFTSATAETAASTWFVDLSQYADSAHGSLKCQECHGPMTGNMPAIGNMPVDGNMPEDGHGPAPGNGPLKGKIHPDPGAANFLESRTQRTFDYQTCKKCHKNSHERSLEGEHAKAAVKEKESGKPSKTGFAPGCGDCHSAHYSKSHKSRVWIGRQMIETCGTCHPEQRVSFLTNYHGRAAVNLGYEKAAFCTDCHGAHTTRSLREKEEALNACRRCHPDATPEFANIIIHDSKKTLTLKNDAKKSGLKWVHIMAGLSLTFVGAILAFFYMHTGLLMLRKLHEKLRRHK